MPEDNRDFLQNLSITEHKFTEDTDVVKDNAQEIIEYLTKRKKINERGLSQMNIRVLTVLGNGWPEIWERDLNSHSTPDLPIDTQTIAFDFDKRKIREFKRDNPDMRVLNIMIGDERGDNKLADVLEGWKPDVLFLSNITDWLLRESVEGDLIEVLEVKLPPVIVFSGTRTDTQFGGFRDALLNLGYEVKMKESGKSDLLVGNQAIAKLKLRPKADKPLL